MVLYRRLLYSKPQDVDEQPGLNFTWSETPKSGFVLQELSCAIIIVRGDRDSRAKLIPIYGDLYQIKIKGITNENHLVTHLGFTSERHFYVIKIAYIVSVQFKRYVHCSLWRSIRTFLHFVCQFQSKCNKLNLWG